MHDYGTGLFLGYCLVLFEEEVEIVALAILEYSTKRIGIDFEYVKELNNTRMIKSLVNVVFAKSMPFEKEEFID